MPIVAEQFRFVVGVDTHAATHNFAVIDARSSKLIGQDMFPTSPAGLGRAASWIGHRTGGDLDGTLIASEGTGSYGAVLAERLAGVGYRVVEAPAPLAKRFRGAGKTDTLDAITAARSSAVMDVDRLRDRRAGELQTALEVLTTACEQMNADLLRSINALTALLRTHALGVDARRALTTVQFSAVATWRHREEPLGLRVARADAVRHAKRVRDLEAELAENRAQLEDLVDRSAPELVTMAGIGASQPPSS